MKNLRVNSFQFIFLFNVFYVLFLILEDRLVYIPSHLEIYLESYNEGWENFINFIKSLWRTGVSVTLRVLFFWMWTFFKIGFIIFCFEIMNIFQKENVVLEGVIYSLFPILVLIFLKFVFLILFKKNFVSSFQILYDNKFLNFFLSSLEFFKFLEFSFLFNYLRKKITLSRIKLIFILIPLFLGETFFEFTYYIK
ncbi:MAG: hypothetical protein QXO40_02460 [Candidatus Aenigmatarchaeota archaeon]